MLRPFGHTVRFTLSLARPWLSLGPGWAALAGALSTGPRPLSLATWLQLVSLWLLVDPLLGTLWDLLVEQGLWRRVTRAQLPPPAISGFSLPYAQAGSPAGRLVICFRRYQVWWQAQYWPESGEAVAAAGLGLSLALLLGLFLGPPVFWLTLLAVGLMVWAGQYVIELTAPGGGRWPTLIQFVLPWLMGCLLWSGLSPLGLALAVCLGSVYLGGLRMMGQHRHADRLFYLGQLAALALLLALRLLPGAASLGVLLVAQWLLRARFNQPSDLLPRLQPYLVLGMLVAGLSIGRLAG
ncbi:MAG: hypothetical protein AB1801_25120 [Chloroflexota bacterium]